MQPFIRVTEIWTPNRTGRVLELADGVYGTLEAFRELSGKQTFEYGEGLPGQAWQQQRPVVFKTFEGSGFARTEAAHEVGLSAGVAVPIFVGDFIKAVLVFLCGDADQLSGAIEVWQDDGQSGMGLVDGYYGDMERFEWLSKSIRFPRGRGLPGSVWATAKPVIQGDLANSSSFLRSRGAADAGITTGIGIPLNAGCDDDEVGSVMSFLSSKGTPIARRFEVWVADQQAAELVFDCGIGDAGTEVEPPNAACRIPKGEGAIGGVWASGIPTIGQQVASESRWHAGSDIYQGLESLLAIPVIQRGSLASVVVFYS